MNHATPVNVESKPGETWAPIERYAGEYSCSSYGRIYSHKSGRLMSTYEDRHGYPRLRLCLNGKPRLEQVAALVLESFVGPRPEGMVVCHWNDVANDSRLANLRWATMSDNRKDSVRNGTHFQARLTHCQRGHALIAPNLRASVKREGRRGCLSCKLEQDRARYYGTDPDYARADQRYRSLTGLDPEAMLRTRLADRALQ